MDTLHFVLLCICVTFVTGKPSFSNSDNHENNINHQTSFKKNKHGWDFLVFTQQWPQTSCISWRVLNPSHKCNISSAVKTWTVHGIWPSSHSSKSPSFCNDSMTFNDSQIQGLKKELYKYWPNIYADTPEDQLWEHEWNKHGTCAAQLPQLKTEELFFTQGIKWFQEYDFLSILMDYGFKPSDKTPVLAHDIEMAIKNKLNVQPALVCEYVPANKTYYIFEIEICFDKKLKLIDCPSKQIFDSATVLGSASCPSNTLVWYPEIEHTSAKTKHLQRKLHVTIENQSFFSRLSNFVLTALPYTW